MQKSLAVPFSLSAQRGAARNVTMSAAMTAAFGAALIAAAPADAQTVQWGSYQKPFAPTSPWN
ncbi:MAG TPA: hypothetical protein VI140_07980, partial [Oxalicibacterium sp.]